MFFNRIYTSTPLLACLLFVAVISVATAVDQKKSLDSKSTSPFWQGSAPSPHSSALTSGGTPKDEIYIDDESLEGSGGRGEIRDDLEKEPDYSGSGFGPDDEDSTTNHRPTQTNTNRNKDRTRISSEQDNIGSGDGDDVEIAEDDDDEDDLPVSSRGRNKTPEHIPTVLKPTTDDDLEFHEPEITKTNKGTVNKDNINKQNSFEENEIDLEEQGTRHNQPTDKTVGGSSDTTSSNNGVFIMNEDRTASFFAQPGILAAVIGGAVVGLLCAILVVMFIVYRMRKKDEGSYALDEPKRSPAVNSYAKNSNNREFYA